MCFSRPCKLTFVVVVVPLGFNNWKPAIGMALFRNQNLFQHAHHYTYDRTGILFTIGRCLITTIAYWKMKDYVPSPYAIDPMIRRGSRLGKKRKYSHAKSCTLSSDEE